MVKELNVSTKINLKTGKADIELRCSCSCNERYTLRERLSDKGYVKMECPKCEEEFFIGYNLKNNLNKRKIIYRKPYVIQNITNKIRILK